MTRAIFFSPHLDDAALSCGGLVKKCAIRGDEPLVVTAFTSAPDAGMIVSTIAKRLHRVWGNEDAEAIWALRRAEDQRAMTILGARSHLLGLHDALYRTAKQAELAEGVRDEDRPIVAMITDVLVTLAEEAGPDVTVYLPLAIGRHVDHQIGGLAAEPLRTRGVRVAHYEDFPYVLHYTESIAERAAAVGSPRGSIEEVTPSELESRLEAIACYKSQLRMLFPPSIAFQDVIRARARELTGTEAYGERIWTA